MMTMMMMMEKMTGGRRERDTTLAGVQFAEEVERRSLVSSSLFLTIVFRDCAIFTMFFSVSLSLSLSVSLRKFVGGI